MRVSHRVLFVFLAGLGILKVGAAATYTTQQLPSSGSRQYIDLNNNLYALTMRQDAPGTENLHIVIENWNAGYYSEFRPGTLPGSTQSTALDFNDANNIVGYAQTLDANGSATVPERAFLYSNGAFTDLSTLPPLNTSANSGSRAISINNLGDVLGYWIETNVGKHWFIYSQGTITDLGRLGSDTTEATPIAINDSKQLTGAHSPPAQQGLTHAFFYSQGVFTDVDAAPQGLGSMGLKINAQGQIAGTSRPSTHAQDCFIYNGSSITAFALHRDSESSCRVGAFNNSGTIVGSASNEGMPPTHQTNSTFLYSNGQVSDLNALLDPNDNVVRAQDWIMDVMAINDAGYIIGKSNSSLYLLTPDSATQPVDNAYYNFEYSTHGWYNAGDPIVSILSSTLQRFAGTASLAVEFNGSGYVSVGGMYPPPLAGKTVTFHIYLPLDARIDWVQPFVLEDYAGNWAWHGNWQAVNNLQLGAWNTITVDIPPDATPGYRIGVEFFASQPYTGTVFIDSVSF